MMEQTKVIHIEETDSTNRWLSNYKGEKGDKLTVVVADYQTAGRGQGCNSWESERGKNLLLSILLHPTGVPVARQFVLLEAAALAIRETLQQYTYGFTVKWPNDIYYGDRKISGTLSECNIGSAGIKRCIIGIGIDINQQHFISDAPNPVSLCQIVGHEVNRDEVLKSLLCHISGYMDIVDEGRFDEIDKQYAASLYRRHGFHRYADSNGEFMASIEKILPNGHLILKRINGTLSEYAFKEVRSLS